MPVKHAYRLQLRAPQSDARRRVSLYSVSLCQHLQTLVFSCMHGVRSPAEPPWFGGVRTEKVILAFDGSHVLFRDGYLFDIATGLSDLIVLSSSLLFV